MPGALQARSMLFASDHSRGICSAAVLPAIVAKYPKARGGPISPTTLARPMSPHGSKINFPIVEPNLVGKTRRTLWRCCRCLFFHRTPSLHQTPLQTPMSESGNYISGREKKQAADVDSHCICRLREIHLDIRRGPCTVTARHTCSKSEAAGHGHACASVANAPVPHSCPGIGRFSRTAGRLISCRQGICSESRFLSSSIILRRHRRGTAPPPPEPKGTSSSPFRASLTSGGASDQGRGCSWSDFA